MHGMHLECDTYVAHVHGEPLAGHDKLVNVVGSRG